ncbi:hypothetical protein RRG08_061540 [Elysia crispata]|uniref:Uncharacterized protein n=1 Tax=Elysia crispata TaxID=231223 RepID=A0AAE1APA9_9GAST|nr:hypothetical protein RRG08_061540 [Elysia crispata]
MHVANLLKVRIGMVIKAVIDMSMNVIMSTRLVPVMLLFRVIDEARRQEYSVERLTRLTRLSSSDWSSPRFKKKSYVNGDASPFPAWNY